MSFKVSWSTWVIVIFKYFEGDLYCSQTKFTSSRCSSFVFRTIRNRGKNRRERGREKRGLEGVGRGGVRSTLYIGNVSLSNCVLLGSLVSRALQNKITPRFDVFFIRSTKFRTFL